MNNNNNNNGYYTDHHDLNNDDIELVTTKSLPLPQQKQETISIIDISIGGMTCSMCTSAVEKALRDSFADNITSVSVSLATNTARIEFIETSSCNPQIMADEIDDIGYDVNDIIMISKAKNKAKPTTTSTTATTAVVVEIAVGGMTCSMCSSAVHKAISEMPNVKSVNVSLSTNIATITYINDDETSSNTNNYPNDFIEMIEDIGYDVNDVIVRENNNNKKNATDNKSNSTTQSQKQQQRDDDTTLLSSDDRLQRLLKQQDQQLYQRRQAFLWSFLGALPIMTITMIVPKILKDTSRIREFLQQHVTVFHHPILVEAVIIWILTTPVQFVCGYSFYKTSYHGIARGVLGMDVLIALGTTASYFYALTATIMNDPGYRFFETSAVLICFVLLGKWMNAMAVRRTSEALTQLMKLQAKTAIKITPKDANKKLVNVDLWNPLKDAYTEQVVPIQKIHPGDIVKILKGASIPADGTVMHGELTVDQSMITGESIPVLKQPGDDVLGGTICGETGTTDDDILGVANGLSKNHALTAAAFVRVTGVGADSALSQIVQMVQEAQSRQVPIQNLADSIASVFVPVVVGLSILTFLTWYGCCKCGIVPPTWYQGESPATFSLLFGIACLVISCPCALGMLNHCLLIVVLQSISLQYSLNA
jgi:Cu+-exporting ATPase